MQFVTLNILTYISGIIGSTTFSQNDILTEQQTRIKKKKDKQNFDIPESK